MRSRIIMRALPVLLILLGCAAIGGASEYITVKEYHELHPGQVAISKRFSARIQEGGRRVSGSFPRAPVRISFVYPGVQISDYWRRSTRSFRGRMEEIGVPFEMSEYFSKPGMEARTQAGQMRAALAHDPDYLVFTLDAAKHRRFIERILTRGRPRLILQNITTPLRMWEGKQPFFYVGFDHVTGSEILGRYFLERTGGNGEYAMLYFTRGYVSTMRGDSFIRYMESRSELKLVASYYTDGDSGRAKDAALAIVRDFPRVRFIYACATDVALGAIDALRQAGFSGRIMVNGWGGGSLELAAIRAKEMDVTVMRMNDDNGVAMAEAIRLDRSGRGGEVPTVYSGDFALVEKGIEEERMAELVARAFRYSSSGAGN